jgi:diguanylate cyclase (GGDEF)-like protein
MDQPNRTFANMRREARASATTRFSRKELAELTLLKDAHQETIVPILQDCAVRLLANGEMLLRAGDSCQALYLILSGRLRVQDPSSTVPDGMIKAGDSVGEMFLMQDATVARTISAVEPTRLLVVDQKVAWELIRASHETARNWLALLAERSRVGGIIRGSEELKTSYKRHATLDECTGLHNRLWLDSIMPRQITRSSKNNSPLALLLVEIDDFAEYSAQFGHAAGDHARYAVAQTLMNSVRPTDLIACHGPASFAIILPESDVTGAVVVGERARHAVSEAVVMMSDESILPSLTVSVGAAQCEAGTDAAAFLAAAETALRSAKTIGGNRVGMQLLAG